MFRGNTCSLLFQTKFESRHITFLNDVKFRLIETIESIIF